MTDGAAGSRTPDDLRLRAEEKARESESWMPESLEALTPGEVAKVLHELRVHQIELEMQNDELRRAQGELEASRARYFSLYDLAPVGYCTLSDEGVILEANLTAASLLGVSRTTLLRRPFVRFALAEDADLFYLHQKRLLETSQPQTFEMRMARGESSEFWARIQSAVVPSTDGSAGCRIVIVDITEQKWAEDERERLIVELQEAMANVRRLSGFLPICANCKKIRDDQGYWNQIEAYIRDHSEAEFSHGLCPECAKELFP